MRILNKWTKAVALAAVFAVATTVAAQTTHHVSSSKIGWGAWTFKPIYADAAAGPQVHSFLVSAPPDVTVGDNIVAVWYVRDPSAPGGWIAKSWETTSRAEVVKSVKTALGISDAEDDRWEFAEKSEIDAVLSPEQSKNYDRGLLADDPFAALLAASPDRDEVVAAIASWGPGGTERISGGSSSYRPSPQQRGSPPASRAQAWDHPTSSVSVRRSAGRESTWGLPPGSAVSQITGPSGVVAQNTRPLTETSSTVDPS